MKSEWKTDKKSPCATMKAGSIPAQKPLPANEPKGAKETGGDLRGGRS